MQSRFLEKKNGVNRQCRNMSNDQILCLKSIKCPTETFKMIGICCTVVEQILQRYLNGLKNFRWTHLNFN